jgi:hypothetical protein
MSSTARIVAIMMLVVCAFPQLVAAQNATVYGSVIDAQGKSASGVWVALDNASIGFHKKTLTDRSGDFRFREVPPASGYQVTAVLQQEKVSPHFVNVNVDDQKEVWPSLRLPSSRTPVPITNSANALLTTAIIYGGVFDSNSKPMKGVQVALENRSNEFSQKLITGDDGRYRFTLVPAGDGYRLTASQAGIPLDVRYPIEAVPNEETNVLPPLRRMSEQAVANETVSPSISGVITGEQLRSLPLYNRNFLALGLIAPETHDTEPGSALAGASFSIAGARSSSNSFLLDGADNVASSSNQAVPFQVNDSIQEFRVISSNATAEYGRNTGGVVNVVTRRAGNTFHGASYGYFGNDALNAESSLSIYNGTTFDKAAAYAGSSAITNLGIGPPPGGQNTYLPLRYNDYVNIAKNNGYCTNSIIGPLPNPSACVASGSGGNTLFDPAAILATHDRFKPSFDSKQFGASAGGALKKDKLFLFGSYEGTRIDNPNPIFERVPTAFDKTYNPLHDPATYQTATASRSLFSSGSPDYLLSQGVLSLFPAPNVVGVPGVLEFFQGEAPNYTHVHNVLVRADLVKTDKTMLSLRHVAQSLKQLHDDSLPAPASSGGYPGNGAFRHVFNQNLSVVLSHSFANGNVNEARIGFNRFNVRETAQDGKFDALSLGSASNGFAGAAMPTILLSGLDPQYSGAYLGTDGAFGSWAETQNLVGGPNGTYIVTNPTPMGPTLDGFFPFARVGAPLDTPSSRADTTIVVSESLNVMFGKHSMKFGLETRRLNNAIYQGGYQRGFLYSANIGEFAHDSETCNQVCAERADVLTRSPVGAPNAFLRPSFDFARQDGAPNSGNLHSWVFAGFLQDSLRAGRRLTISYGLRYEYFSPSTDGRGRVWNYDPNAGGVVPTVGTPTTMDPYGNLCGALNPMNGSLPSGGIRFPQSLPWTNCQATGNPTTVPAKYNNFAPRFGLALDLFGNGKTILRTGASLFWDELPVNYTSQLLFDRPVTSANAVYDQIIDPRACPKASSAVSPINFAGCGLGSSMINPSRRGQTDLSSSQALNNFFTNAAFPFAIYARDRAHAGTPRTVQVTLNIQRQVSNQIVVEVGYLGALARDLPIVFNSQASTEFAFAASNPPIATFPVFTMTNQAQSDYHSFLARMRAAQWHGIRANATYIFSRSLDNASSSDFFTQPVTLDAIAAQQIISTGNPGSSCFLSNSLFVGSCGLLIFPNIDFSTSAVTTTGASGALVTPYKIPQDPFHYLANDWGRSDFDVKHRFVLDYTWQVPSLQNKFGWTKWLDYWQLSGIFVAQSGQPFTIFSAPASVEELTQRVNLAGTPVLDMSHPKAAISTSGITPAFPSCGFRFLLATQTACIGNSPRNGFSGPNYTNMDFAVQKGFPVGGESRMLTIRSEIYNLFNRANYDNPISNFSTDGVNPNPNFGKIKSAHDPLHVQFSARFTW